MENGAEDLESFRRRIGVTAIRERENASEDVSPEAIAARKELIHKNLFSRKIKREESVKELAELLAISRGRVSDDTDEEMGQVHINDETTEDSSAPLQEASSSEDSPSDVPEPSAPPLTETDNIATAIFSSPDRSNTDTTNPLETKPENSETAPAESSTTATAPREGSFIMNLLKGLSNHDLPPQSQEQTAAPQCQSHRCKLECAICLEVYKPNDTIAWAKDGGDPPSASVALTNNGGPTSGCDHIFHEGCLVSWLEHHDDCPLCRRKLIHEDADVRFSGAGWELGQ